MVSKKKEQIIIKALCFLAAFGLWMYIYNSETPIVTGKIAGVPVQIINKDSLDQSKLAVINEESCTVTLNLQGRQVDLDKVTKSDFKLVADVSAYAVRKGELSIPVTVKRSPTNINILKNEELYVTITFDNVIQKNVPVKVDLQGSAKDAFYNFKPVASPTEAAVKGAETYVNKVSYVSAKGQISDTNSDILMSLPLIPMDNAGKQVSNVSVNPTTTEVTASVYKVKTVGINVKTQGNKNNNVTISSLTPSQDKVDIAGNPEVIDKIDSIDTMPIDLSNITNSTSVNAKLVCPTGITFVNCNGTIKVTVNADATVQKSFTVNLQQKNLGSSFTATSDIQQVTVTVSGLSSVMDKVNTSDIVCFIDLSSCKEGDNTVPVSVTLPTGLTKVSFSNDTVKVTLKKK